MPLGVIQGWLRAGRRVPKTAFVSLSSKRGPRGYYKGKGCQPVGRHTSKGKYVIMPEKLPQFVVPDLTGFKLKPYVSHDTPKVVPEKAEAAAS
ncbi:hypothetical protein O6H91_03G042000 [Diphasiastrum complanatum]|uniref:Uncharacterized protein n=1 Tax=Diphasiastrum complanatum TaxID=34168 RepID=A0ACC2E5E2_DIPCM|nr:hypothetical protein O6H91_Y251300 [Diphasiastrum complanatum]KAJ7561808.1 hypothetical protein O6H91_03G042000 [Diphasiastrum complanatum]